MNELLLGGPPPPVVETDRLTMRAIGLDDAEFIRRLLNEPSFLRFIGDRGVRTVDDACAFIEKARDASKQGAGGTYLVELTADPHGRPAVFPLEPQIARPQPTSTPDVPAPRAQASQARAQQNEQQPPFRPPPHATR